MTSDLKFSELVQSLSDVYSELEYNFILKEYDNLTQINSHHPNPHLQQIQLKMESCVGYHMLNQVSI